MNNNNAVWEADNTNTVDNTSSYIFSDKIINHSCVNKYKESLNDISQFETNIENNDMYFVIKHQNGLSWKNNKNNISLKNGKNMYLCGYFNKDNNPNYAILFNNNNSDLALSHNRTNLILDSYNYNKNSTNFNWKFIPIGNNQYYIMSMASGREALENKNYIGYDTNQDSLIMVSEPNKIIWNITTFNKSFGIKSKYKALAMMHVGQGEYNNNFREVNSCVLPKETHELLNLDKYTDNNNNNNCLLRKKKNNELINKDLKITKGGSMNLNLEIANKNIKNGKSVYPIDGCSIDTSNLNSSKKTIIDVSDAINSNIIDTINNNNNNIKNLRDKLVDLLNNLIPTAKTNLINTETEYNNQKAICDKEMKLNSIYKQDISVLENIWIPYLTRVLPFYQSIKLDLDNRINILKQECSINFNTPNQRVYVSGPIGSGPWGNVDTFPDRYAKLVWNVPNATSWDVPVNINITFQGRFKSDVNINATLYIVVDNYTSTITFNGQKVLIDGKSSFYGGWGHYGDGIYGGTGRGRITIKPGYNLLTIVAGNLGGPAALLYSVIGDNKYTYLRSDENTVFLT